jgi:TM2 domain-containing membrane protein YozV
MMYCENCSLFFMDDVKDCPECGWPLTQTIKELPEEEGDALSTPSDFANALSDELSPKKRDTVILLAYFLGIFGVHRFYLGKIMTGILMLLSLGGLTVWYTIDFILSIIGNYSDSKGRFVGKEYSRRMVAVLLLAPVILLIGATFVLFFVALKSYGEGFFQN